MYLTKEQNNLEITQPRIDISCNSCICWKRRLISSNSVCSHLEGVCTNLDFWAKAGFSTHGVITLEHYSCPYGKERKSIPA